ncbi:MAG: hypothetical protein JWR88_2099 [Pseudonocardia sp.]|nr:hypothetical protein [Pseudonocardia sp.]
MELSGLVAGADGRWAIVDGGGRVQVFGLATDCSVRQVVAGGIDPFDVEDLARSPDGVFWLADIGDNDRRRSTIALITLSGDGSARLHRLTYPDGPHDAEALLLDGVGTPLLVTKEPTGPAGIYQPTGRLAEPGPTPLSRVGQLDLPPSRTVGGPVGGVGTRLVTGGATTADSRLAAVRTYTDAWLFPAPDGDLLAALGRPPMQVPLPGEPQGEAIAFGPDGTLLSGSESPPGTVGKLRAVPGAVARAAVATGTTEPPRDAAAPAPEGRVGTVPGILVALALSALIVFGLGKLRRKKK